MPDKDEDILEQYGQTGNETDREASSPEPSSSEETIPKGFWWIIIALFVIGSLFFGGLYFSLVKGSKAANAPEAKAHYIEHSQAA